MTGTREDRPEFQRMLSDCRAGKIDLIVTKSASRLARNTLTLLLTVRELKEIGVPILFERENLLSTDGKMEMLLSLLASVAQEESRATSENCKWRIRDRFKHGELVGFFRMYGYRISGLNISVYEPEAEIVRRVFHQYLSGVGCKAIADGLNADGVLTCHKGLWTAARIYEVLKNEKYTGNALLQKSFVVDHISKRQVRNKGELPKYYAQNTHPAIIPQSDFDRAQAMLERRRLENNIARQTPARHAFTGKILCENCGARFQRRMNHGLPQWQCGSYLRKGRDACQAKQIPESVLMALAARALGMEAFEETAFKEAVKEIRVTGNNLVAFVFTDGHTTELSWQDRSRRESWTPAMREAARQQALKQRGN